MRGSGLILLVAAALLVVLILILTDACQPSASMPVLAPPPTTTVVPPTPILQGATPTAAAVPEATPTSSAPLVPPATPGLSLTLIELSTPPATEETTTQAVAQSEPPFYCITGGQCDVPPAPGQLPVPTKPPPLSPEEWQKQQRQIKAAQDFALCLGEAVGLASEILILKGVTLYGTVLLDGVTNTGQAFGFFQKAGSNDWYGAYLELVPGQSCYKVVTQETKPLKEFAAEERKILKMWYEKTYHIGIEVLCDNLNLFGLGDLALYLCGDNQPTPQTPTSKSTPTHTPPAISTATPPPVPSLRPGPTPSPIPSAQPTKPPTMQPGKPDNIWTEPVPEVCIAIYEPVHDARGNTYSNECDAARKGVRETWNGEAPVGQATPTPPVPGPKENPACPQPSFGGPSMGIVGDTITVQGGGWLPGGTVAGTLTGPRQYNAGSVLVPASGIWEHSISLADKLPGGYELEFSEEYGGCDLGGTFTIPPSLQP
jgi:hypothetical protein